MDADQKPSPQRTQSSAKELAKKRRKVTVTPVINNQGTQYGSLLSIVNMRHRSKLRVVWVIASALLLALVGLFAETALRQREVENLRGAISGLMRPDASYADAIEVANAYRRFRVPPRMVADWADGRHFEFGRNDACVSNRCVIDFVATNGLIGSLHIVQPARFSASVVVLHGRVVQAGMSLVGGPYGVNAGRVTYTDCCDPAADVLRTAPGSYSFHTPVGKPYLSVYFSNEANASERKKAIALNLNCFVAAAGCGKPCDYLPLAWKDYVQSDRSGWLASHPDLSCKP